ncbi:PEP-CTERM sorting domain-containing protein [Verrucomicrobiaceae bacterium R5-34]|uniref:PEP-CTERM sorting domain-containing protein n=1 Tax=Oceaniferula flava TaxID=2800421 RepID=A0AAE2SD76_9BACT|nr:PEP-CTERM sorting domain-containing protein [Oceaniferula flavus]MBK1832121.1 PEP-CTERM sorting domain-containing protein [Verrucomicrobiaceae bacterium R5-34]MBK1856233.1 PEP-CTERM sorting domain-containing protein [Oceaniferula flavus]MBM1137540.1 PEP-CTERM sorting domain-containing protein [Oceaniferula flavus]
MKKPFQSAALAAVILPLTVGVSEAVVIANYDFTAYSLTNSVGVTPGVTVSDFSVGNYGDLTDNGASDNLRLSGDDNTDNSTGAAFTNGNFLSFSVTVADGYTMDLNTLSIDTQVTNAFQYSNARIYTSIQGFDDVVDDTIAQIGVSSGGGFQALTTNIIDFNGDSYLGSNISDADFNGLTDTTVTFYIPWVDNSGSDTRYSDVDNVSLDATVTVIPEPSSAMLLGLGGLALVLRRKK